MAKKVKIERVNIFQVSGIKNTNYAKVKLAGYINNEEQFEDEPIILDDKTKSTVKEVMENVFIKMYKCRMTDQFVASHKKLPLMYASLYYQKKYVTGFLFSIYVYFDIKSDTSKFKTLQAFLSSDLKGEYTMEIVMDNKTEVIKLEKFAGYDNTITNLINIIQTDAMKNIINIELKKRDEERRQKFGEIVANKPREPKYNFSELLERMEKGEDIDDITKSTI